MASRKGSSNVSSSTNNAAFFASQVPADPVPQPGKFPVVFRTGVGEPTNDVSFAYDPERLNDATLSLADRYVYNPRYAEFSDHAGYGDALFERDVVRMFLLGLAQQTVFSHVNMGLALGDLGSLASTDVFQFTALSHVIRQYGEFSDPSLGSRFLLADYMTTVTSLVRAAKHIGQENAENQNVVRRMWIPTKKGDKRTKFILARALSKFIENALRVRLATDELMDHLFDNHWDVFTNLKPLFGATPALQDRFDFLFSGYVDEPAFVTKFTGAGPQGVLRELGLKWSHPDASHLAFELVPKTEFPELVDDWARKRAAIAAFISCTSGVANRAAACGTQAQISSVKTTAGVTVVKTHVALGAPEFSLMACFPPSALFDEVGPLNVSLPTSVSVANRATEFLQTDWKG